MMDQKTWLWRKRSSEKSIVAIGEEVKSIPNQKEIDLGNTVEALNEELASVLDECSAKQELVEKYKKTAENAIADKHKADEEIERQKHELHEIRQQRGAESERLFADLNSALKDCMEQLNQSRKEQDQKIEYAVSEKSKEFEKSRNKLEEKIGNLTAESAYFSKALVVKEKIIGDLNRIKNQTEGELEVLMKRLDSIEKENAFLRYEFRALEKEVEFGRCSLEASRKKHSENLKKIKKLEGECQRMRGLTQKKLPDSSSTPENTRKKMGLLVDQVRDLEKENKVLKECLAKKEEEAFYSRKSFEEKFSSVNSNEVASSRSWGASDMSLMDDFVEMEKLAIIAIDSPFVAPDSKNSNDWLRNVRDAILEQRNISKKSVEELLGEIRMDLNSTINVQPISGYITWKSPSSKSTEEWGLHCDLNKSIDEIIEILGRFNSSHTEEDEKIIHVFKCERSEVTIVMQEFTHACNNLLDGKIDIEKLANYSISFIRWIFEKCIVSHQGDFTVREEFEKHLGGAGPGTALELESVQSLMVEMEKKFSICRVEIEGLKNELNNVKLSNNEDREIENLIVMNEDLDTRLTVTKAKLDEVVQKLSSVEVDLDDKSRSCEELEEKRLELQLQLESITSNPRTEDNENREELLQTGLEITKASVIGNQRSSLRDHMQCEDSAEADDLLSPETKEIIDTIEMNAQSVYPANISVKNGKEYIGTKNEGINGNAGALVIVPSKKKGGIGFWRKVLLRRKKANCKNGTSIYFSK
ncbi:hypothetical protein ABFS83_02G036000 [Erythranthe nasuta]